MTGAASCCDQLSSLSPHPLEEKLAVLSHKGHVREIHDGRDGFGRLNGSPLVLEFTDHGPAKLPSDLSCTEFRSFSEGSSAWQVFFEPFFSSMLPP
jgi:hypothetical protein